MDHDKQRHREEDEDRAGVEGESVQARGASVSGSVSTGGGDFIGRDKISHYYGEIIVRLETIEDLPPAPGEPPYKGLAYFTEADADVFFGRERVTAKLVERLQTARFLAVVGASGSGKSSLLRAGVVPALRRENWGIHVLTPAADPLRSLTTSLTRDDLAADSATLKARLGAEPGVLPEVAGKLAARANQGRLLLVVDQFEETFTLCQEERERQAFIECLQAADAAGSTVTVLIGVRADFYDRCLQYEGLRRVLREQQEPLGPMTQEELMRVIAEPAKRDGWQFVEGLVEQMLADVGQEPGRLPLLSHALLETWERRRGTVMTLAGYRATGGVEEAIAQSAEKVLRGLPEGQVEVVKNVFFALTELGEGAEDTRRVADAQDLAGLGPEGEVGAVLERLVRARLVKVDEGQVEVAHEALIRRWPRLREWLADNRERLRFERQLARDAREWERLERDLGALYRGARLARALEWKQEKTSEQISPLAADFLEASRELAEREEREEKKRQRRELEQAQQLAATAEAREQAEAEARRQAEARAREQEQATTGLRRRALLLGGLLLVALLLAGLSWWLFGVARDSEGEAVAESTRAAINLERAVTSEAVAEVRAADLEVESTQAAANLERAVAGEAVAEMRAADLAAESTRAAHNLATAVAAQSESEKARQETERALRVSESRRLAIAASSQSPPVRALLLAAHSGYLEETYEGFNALVTLTSDRASRVLSLQLPETVNSVEWSPDDKKFLTLSESTIVVWDLESGNALYRIRDRAGFQSAAWHRDGSEILVLTHTGRVIVFDAGTGKAEFEVVDDADILAIYWISDGKNILVDTESSVKLRDASNGNEVASVPLSGDAYLINWSDDGSKLLLNDGTGSTKVISTESGDELFSVDDRRFVSMSRDGNQVLVNDQRETKIHKLETGIEISLDLANIAIYKPLLWSADGQKVLLVDGTTSNGAIWDTETGEILNEYGSFYDVASASWSNDGGKLLITYGNFTIQHGGNFLNPPETWRNVVIDAQKGTLLSIVESEPARWSGEKNLLSTVNDKIVTIWQPWPTEPTSLRDQARDIHAVEWNAGETKILVTRHDTVTLLDALSLAPIRTFVREGDNLFGRWSPRGDRFIIVAGDTAAVWDSAGADQLAMFEIQGHVWYAVWNETGTSILFSVRTEDNTLLRLIDVDRQEVVWSVEYDGSFMGTAKWNQAGTKIITEMFGIGESAFVNMLDSRTGDVLWTREGFYEWQWSSDYATVLMTELGYREAYSQDSATGEVIYSFGGENDGQTTSSRVSWNPTGEFLAIWEREGNLVVRDVETESSTLSLSFRSEPRRLESGPIWSTYNSDHMLVPGDRVSDLWDVREGKHIFTLQHDYPIESAYWSVDGRRIVVPVVTGSAGTGCESLFLQIYDGQNGRRLADLGETVDDCEFASLEPQWLNADSRVMLEMQDTSRLMLEMRERFGLSHVFRVFYLGIRDYADTACSQVGRNLTWEEWRLLMGAQPYECTCADLPVHSSVIEAKAELAPASLCADNPELPPVEP